jgi:S-adenosylmethionine:tRNA ribosyltransferase-isomerase
LLTSEFFYDLPEARIAKNPLPDRTASKLLVYGDDGAITHAQFAQIGQYLPKNAVLVLNDTRVLPARLPMLNPQGQPIEILLLEPLEGSAAEELASRATSTWKAMVGGKRKWKGDGPIYLDSHTKVDVQARWINRDEDIINLSWMPDDLTLAEVLDVVGQMPLPPYLNRASTARDKVNYQTVFAKQAGAVAAPTAGLHLTPELLTQLEADGHPNFKLTLHVGAGTFKPVKTEQLEDHDMHAERYALPLATLQALAQEGRPIVPVGTTSLRTLETLYWRGVSLIVKNEDQPALPSLLPYELASLAENISFAQALQALADKLEKEGHATCTGSTALFIMPGYNYRSCVGLITNFHQPSSTLLALVSALVGPAWTHIYQTALDNGYRFLSYGDSSLLMRPKA